MVPEIRHSFRFVGLAFLVQGPRNLVPDDLLAQKNVSTIEEIPREKPASASRSRHRGLGAERQTSLRVREVHSDGPLSELARCALCYGALELPMEHMTPELKMLGLSIVLGLAQIVLASHAASLQRGYMWTASARDGAVPALTGLAGRLDRALRNFIETFPLFAAAVLMAHIAGKHSWMTEWGAQLYFGARVAYVAFYAAGIFLVRSLVWNVATVGIILILLSLIWG